MKLICYHRSNHGQRPKLATFDVETEGLGGRVLACSFQTEDMPEPVYLHKGDFIQEMFYFMCENHAYTWFAHNAQYDLRYLIDHLEADRKNMSIYMRTDTDVYMISLNLPDHGEKARLTIRDSLALFPSTLEQFGSVFAPEMPKLKIDVANFDPKIKEHQEYCKRDTSLLLLCLQRFHDLVEEHFDITPATTAAATALKGWQRTLAKKERYYPTPSYESFIRTAYYGGLVFLTDTNIHQNTKSYDVNSSYPYQMETYQFPLGNPVNTRRFRPGVLGIYQVTVKTPDDLIVPILPTRHKGGIVWPRGTFKTTVTNLELEFALDHGYRLLGVHEGVIWEETCNPFRPFVAKCKAIRKQYKGTALETVAKLMQNSLYGKFGSKRQRKKIYADFDDDEVFTGELWGEYLIRLEENDDMMVMPQWAVFVTANARLHLLRAIYQVGPENVLYGDTDSITLKAGSDLLPEQVGAEYGQFKLEKHWQYFRAHAPKVYAGKLISGAKAGKMAGAVKGIPRSRWHDGSILEAVAENRNVSVTYETLNNFVLYLKGKRDGSFEANRSISKIENSKSWAVRPDGTVRPREWSDIQVDEQSVSTSDPFGNAKAATG